MRDYHNTYVPTYHFSTISTGYIIQSSISSLLISFRSSIFYPPSSPVKASLLSLTGSDNIDIPLDQNLLGLAQLLNNILRHSQSISSNIDRRECQPLRNTNINYPITLVKLQPMQVFRLGCVFNIMPGIVGEDSSVARGEIKCARVS